jgi:hypothetical protein
MPLMMDSSIGVNVSFLSIFEESSRISLRYRDSLFVSVNDNPLDWAECSMSDACSSSFFSSNVLFLDSDEIVASIGNMSFDLNLEKNKFNPPPSWNLLFMFHSHCPLIGSRPEQNPLAFTKRLHPGIEHRRLSIYGRSFIELWAGDPNTPTKMPELSEPKKKWPGPAATSLHKETRLAP